MKNLSEEALEDILRKAENTHISGSTFQKAKIELEIRRNRKLFKSQDRLLTTLQEKLEKIASILRCIGERLIKSVLIAGFGAITIGVVVSLISSYFQNLFGF